MSESKNVIHFPNQSKKQYLFEFIRKPKKRYFFEFLKERGDKKSVLQIAVSVRSSARMLDALEAAIESLGDEYELMSVVLED